MVSSSMTMGQSHFYAQKLNNSAALCIKVGHYDRAIHSLSKALRLAREQSDESLMSGCPCSNCCLEGCIAYTESTPSVCNSNRFLSNDSGCGTVYERPIKIPPLPIVENHNMGRILFLIITFNIALAHHLEAIAVSPHTISSSSHEDQADTVAETHTEKNLHPKGTYIKKALQLYELSFNWYCRLTSTGHECKTTAIMTPSIRASIRFQMIISNNLSHIHRLGNNYSKHRQCLQHLLSTVMVAVEYKTRTNSSTSTSAATNGNTTTNANTGNESSQPSTRNNSALCTTNVEGFLMNASHLFLENRCSEAA